MNETTYNRADEARFEITTRGFRISGQKALFGLKVSLIQSLEGAEILKF